MKRIPEIFKEWPPRLPAISRRRAGLILSGVAGFLILMLLGFGWHWSREPARFDVVDAAQKRLATDPALDPASSPAPGYVMVSTHMRLMETLLEKPGSFVANDPLPPGTLMDNMPSWELGVLSQIRDFGLVLRLNMGRPHAQAVERPELLDAQTRFVFSHDEWLMPAAETEYRNGLMQLQLYADALNDGSATFNVRPDALDEWLRKVERRLGTLTMQLRANAGADQYNPNINTSAQEKNKPPVADPVPWREIDNVFYEARGTAWAIYHLMKAVKTDYELVIDNMLAMGTLNRALSNLHEALEPMQSPVVLNGKHYSSVANHSITLSAYLAKAHLAVSELRGQMNGG